tara:strand:- start:43 stop:855 length:813 start_codon:yes stop_codon:yes gene_type:complete
MGDRTTVTIIIQREHMDAFLAATEDEWGEPNETDDPIFKGAHEAVKIWYYEVNYGGVRVLEEVAQSTGLTFIGTHGSGHQYSPETFYAHGGGLALWQCGEENDGFVVSHPDSPRFAEEVIHLRQFAHTLATIRQQILFGGGLYEPEGTWLHGAPTPAPRGFISRPREALAIVNKHLHMHSEALALGGDRAYLTRQWIDAQAGDDCHDCMLVIGHSKGQHGKLLCFDKAYDHDCIPQFRALCDELSQSGFSIQESYHNWYTGVHDFKRGDK